MNGDELAAGPTTAAVADQAVDVVPATAAQVEPLEVSRGQFMGEVAESREARGGRLTEPLVRKDGELVAVGWSEALEVVADGIRRATERGGPEAVALLGGARCTNEGAYAWTKLAKGVIGTDSVDAQLGDGLPAEVVLSLPRATIDEACSARAVLVLAGDLREELPVLFLRLRTAALAGDTAIVEVGPTHSSLSDLAAVSLRARPGDVLALAEALAAGAPDAAAPPAHPEGAVVTPEELARARTLVRGDTGDTGTGLVVVLGRPSLAEHGDVVAAAALRIAAALPGARFLPALRRGNVMGALELGMAPGLLPGRVSLDAGRAWYAEAWGSVPEGRGRNAAAVLGSLAQGTREAAPRVLLVVGADPAQDFVDAARARDALEAAELVVAVTGHSGTIDDWADVVLPVAVEHERPGSTTNIESRVSRLGQKLVPPGQVWSDWMIAAQLAAQLDADLGFSSTDDVWDEIERLAPSCRGVTRRVLGSAEGHDGVVVPRRAGEAAGRGALPIDPMATPGVESVERHGAAPWVGLAEPRQAEQPQRPALGAGSGGEHREGTEQEPRAPEPGAGLHAMAEDLQAPHVAPADSYSLRLLSVRRLYDSGAAVSHSPSLVPLVREATVRANPYDLDRLGAGAGDAVTVRAARGVLTLPCAPDPSVPRGVVAIDFNVPAPGDAGGNAAACLIDADAAVVDVRMESVR